MKFVVTKAYEGPVVAVLTNVEHGVRGVNQSKFSELQFKWEAPDGSTGFVNETFWDTPAVRASENSMRMAFEKMTRYATAFAGGESPDPKTPIYITIEECVEEGDDPEDCIVAERDWLGLAVTLNIYTKAKPNGYEATEIRPRGILPFVPEDEDDESLFESGI